MLRARGPAVGAALGAAGRHVDFTSRWLRVRYEGRAEKSHLWPTPA